MRNKNDCLICGAKLEYRPESISAKCVYCDKTFMTQVVCQNDHFICDACHSSDANDIIFTTCIESKETNPFKLANQLFLHPSVKMHGPEHHFLVPAVLLACYHNKRNEDKSKNMQLARQRSADVPGGSCGYHGVCGAAIGTGMFFSLITNTSPLSQDSWGFCNKTTADTLNRIACYSGPRCCKRDSFIALQNATSILKEKFHMELEVPDKIKCRFHPFNHECLKEKCEFYSNQMR